MAKKETKTSAIDPYVEACKFNGKEPINEKALLELGVTAKQIAGMKLEEICLAKNKGIPTDIHSGEARYYPVFWSGKSRSAFAFDSSFYDRSFARAGSGSRLSCHNRADSDSFGRDNLDLWYEYLS